MKINIKAKRGLTFLRIILLLDSCVIRLVCAVLVLALWSGSESVLSQAYIVKDGEARAEIIIAENPPRLVKLAAEELQVYLKKISDADVPLVINPGTEHPVKIYVGKSEYTDQLGVTDEGLKYGAFRMVSGEDYLILLGNDFDFEPKGPVPMNPWPGSIPDAEKEWDKLTGSAFVNPMNRTYKSYHRGFGFWLYDEGGSLNAVYELLRMLGARWYMPGEMGEILPELASIPLPTLDRTVHPDFPLRYLLWSNYRAGAWEEVIWERRIGLSSAYEVLGAGQAVHGMRDVQGRYEMKKAHPDYYALRDGVRDTLPGGAGHACFSSEGLVHETVKFARAVFDDFDMPAMSVWPMDGYRHCQCELCQGKSASELVWGFADRVAREVYKTHPDRWVTCGAYTPYIDPPESIDKFSPNLVVIIASVQRPEMDHPEKWEAYLQRVESWQQKTDSGRIIRNSNNRYSLWVENDEPIPFPVIHPRNMAKDHRAMKGISLGDWNEVTRTKLAPDRDQVWRAPGADHLNIYVQARYLWDADQDIDTLLENYYTLFYGPAREEMKTALEFAEASYSRTDQSRNGGKCDPRNVELPVKIELLELLHAARDTAGETVYGQRIQTIIDELPPLESIRPEVKETASMTVVDRATGDPVYRAEIQYGENTMATDYSGRVNVEDLSEGKFVYTIDHKAYFPVTDSIVISGDTSLVVSLTRRLAYIRFEVSDSLGPVADAPVSLFSWEILTNSDGMAWFNNQPARQQYAYTVAPEGYQALSDTLFLEIDTTVSVMLQLATGINSNGFMEAAVFPNPASDKLYIRTGSPNASVLLLNPEGKVLMKKRIDRGVNMVDVSGLPPGLYFLNLQTGDQNAYWKVVLQ